MSLHTNLYFPCDGYRAEGIMTIQHFNLQHVSHYIIIIFIFQTEDFEERVAEFHKHHM